MFRKRTIAMVFCSVLAIQGCGEKSATEYMQEAQTALSEGSTETAMIQLKNVLRIEPQNAEARFLLGKLYLERGDWAFAQKELERALELSYSADEVVPLVAEAYRKMGADSQLLKLDLKSKGIKKSDLVKIRYYQAKAYIQGQQEEKAQSIINEIKQIKTNSEYKSLTSYLEYKLKKQDDAALIQLKAVLDKSPEHPEALLLTALESLKQGDAEAGIEFLAKYRDVAPLEYEYHFLLAQLYVDYKKYEKAEEVVDELLTINANQPYLNQIKALVRFHQKDFEQALHFANISIMSSPEDIPTRLVAGAAAFELRKFEEVYQHLNLIASALPENHQALRLLAKSQLELGYALEANDTVKRFVELDERDAILLSSIAGALSQSGEKKKASQLIMRNEENKLEGETLTQFGLVKLSLNDVSGILDLENSLPNLTNDENQKVIVQQVLSNSYLRSGKFEEASKIAQEWLQQDAMKFDGHMLMAAIAVSKNEKEQATASYLQAQKIRPTEPSPQLAVINLMPTTSQDEQFAVLVEVDKMIAKFPNFIPAVLKRYVLAKVLKQPIKMISHLESLRIKNNNAPQIINVLGKMYLLEGENDKAIALFESIKTDTPADYWQSLANAYVKNDNFEKAVEIYRKWFEKEPNNSVAIFGMARVLQMRGDHKKALELTTRFKNELGGEDIKIDLFHIQLLITNEDYDEAAAAYDLLPKSELQRPYTKGLLGQLQFVDKKYKDAKTNLEIAYKARPTSENATLMMKAIMNTTDKSAAIDFLTAHVEAVPKDQINLMILAGLQLSVSQSSAIPTYKKAVALNDSNFVALNNLAYLVLQQGDLKLAEEYATKALEIQPTNASVMDTLASVAVKKKEFDRAEELLANAMEAMKNNIDETIFVNYIEILLLNDKKTLANRQIKRYELSSNKEKQRLQSLMTQYNI
ncbi:PEP-CTERM system TPR-repeat protein PrsT [Psychrosphaera sp. B3R10]|uniref:XrtA/PEP-CTERM system TPR-repeat protein PrsT n=1 Tax=unclassified Psychrosphaera TaxID=2641570 RepID=UPI001C0A5513|nr:MULTISPECIES: XrtA/PEP-CTERM system TPR-repeat protein PrsT [unclassified Psychrosphaera]MBU2882432.1 PEP-CTERM system TPR-repeat protein PrsT [Psychrosphaera sp. I2R16]MBU2990253.1 PEP-CTERM system TPR-repeat protein PrsT [Psychrosphaera sp. B3R10]